MSRRVYGVFAHRDKRLSAFIFEVVVAKSPRFDVQHSSFIICTAQIAHLRPFSF